MQPLIAVLDNGTAEQDIGLRQEGLGDRRQQFREARHAAAVHLDGAGMLAQTDGDHLAQAAFPLPAEAGVWLYAIQRNDVIRFIRVPVAIDAQAVHDRVEVHDLHRRLDGYAHLGGTHAIVFDDLLLAFSRARPVAAHGRDDERLGARFLQLVQDRDDNRLLAADATASDRHRNRLAGQVDVPELFELGGDGGRHVLDRVSVELLPGADKTRQGHADATGQGNVDVRRYHGVSPRFAGPCPVTFSILIAADAAPKPLSMFTTNTPGAQEASAEVNAALPPSATPDPTEVGTAITGAATSPASTENKGSLEPGGRDDDPPVLKLRCGVGQPPQSGNADVLVGGCRDAGEFQCTDGFARGRRIRCSSRNDSTATVHDTHGTAINTRA